ncbi:hypothetical protein EDB83DRAFT_2530703 [Lactarius deliciosus]|nr:hypothetical protein EDB83DRAFT_2530703 [Lactarius deliciosus]
MSAPALGPRSIHLTRSQSTIKSAPKIPIEPPLSTRRALTFPEMPAASLFAPAPDRGCPGRALQGGANHATHTSTAHIYTLNPRGRPSPQPEPQSPVQGQNGKNPSARSSMGPAARPSEPQRRASVSPSHALEAGPLAGAQRASRQRHLSNPRSGCYRPVVWDLSSLRSYAGMDAASLDVNFKEELSAIEQCEQLDTLSIMMVSLSYQVQVQIHFFITVLQQMARADPMAALLSPAVGGSMQSQMEAKLASMNLKSPGLKSTMPSSPSARTFNTSATNCQPLAFDSSSSFLSPDAANTVGNPSNAAATLAQQRAKLNAAHRISAPALASSGDCGTWAGVSAKPSRPQSTDFSGLSAGSAFRSPRADGGTAPGSLDGLSPAVGDSWASIANTPLLPMFQKSSSNNSNNGQTVDLAAAELNDLYRSSNVPRLDGPDKFRRPSKGHIHDGSSGSNNGVTNNGVYGDDGGLIQGHHAPGVGRVQSGSSRGLRNGGGGTWSGGRGPALSNSSDRFGGSDDGSNAIAAVHQQHHALSLSLFTLCPPFFISTSVSGLVISI